MKKVISLLLTVILLISVIPAGTVTANALSSSGSCGDTVTYTFNSSTGELVISGEGPMENYSSTSSPFYNQTEIKSVIIEDGVSIIGDYAFSCCSSLTSVTIPDSVTSIGDYAFEYCSSLISITIPDSVTSIGHSAFSDCRNLTDITIPDSVTYIGPSAFYDCRSLTSIIIPDSVISIGDDTFSLCSGLTSVIIGDSVAIIGENAFYNCSAIKELTLPCSSKINNSQYTFGGCNSIEKVTLTKGTGIMQNYSVDTSFSTTSTYYKYTPWYISRNSIKELIIQDGVTSIGSCAVYCSSLASITIPDSVTSIGDSAFSGCSSLTSVTIGDSVAIIGEDAFMSCYRLTNINIKSLESWCNISYIDSNDNPLHYAHNLYLNGKLVTDLIIPEGVKNIDNYAFSGCSSFTSVTIPDSVTSIGDSAFYGCSRLTRVTIADSVTSIGKGTFYNCSGIKELTLPCSTKIYDSEYTFGGCTNIEKVTLTKGTGKMQDYSTSTTSSNTYYQYTPWYISKNSVKEVIIEDGVTNIGYSAFYNCTELTSITISDSVTSISSHAFYGCSSLSSVNISSLESWCNISFNGSDANPLYYAHNLYLNGKLVTDLIIPEGVKSIDNYVFEDCSSITSVTIPNSVTNIDYCAFYGCSSLTSVTIPDSVTIIGSGAFYNCSRLASVTIPDSVTSIGDSAFSGCTSLTSVTIGDSVTSIGNHTFNGCSSLTSVNIPDSVKSIGDSAFYNCGSLASVTISDSVTSIGKSIFYNCSSLTSVTIGDGLTNIGSSAFYGCSRLKDVTIGNSVKSISESAFYNCGSLASVNIPNSVTSIGKSAFDRCRNLTSVIIGDSVTSIGNGAFFNCSKLKELSIPCSAKIYNSWTTFDGCTNIERVTLTKGTGVMQDYSTSTTSSATYYQYTPWYISKNSVKEIVIEGGATKLGENAFKDCASQCEFSYNGHKKQWDKINLAGSGIGSKTINYLKCDVTVDKSVLPTCTESGLTEGSHCSGCETVWTAQKTIQPLGHTIVTDKAVAPTCTTTGLAEGSHCSVCEAVLVAQKTVQSIGHVFTNYKSDDNSTCTNDGTKTAKCNRCEATDTVTDVNSKLGHNYVGLVTTEPTCANQGVKTYTCSRCSDSYTEPVSTIAHTVVTDKAVASTCTETGLTEGSHCSVCGEVFVAQETVKSLGHDYGSWIVTKAPTCVPGQMLRVCQRCTFVDTLTVSATDSHKVVTDSAIAPTCTATGLTEGSHCSVCGEVLVAQEVIEAKGHAVVTDEAVAPTCTATGLTGGSHCSVCGEVFVTQQSVQPLGHAFTNYKSDDNSTCTSDGTKTAKCNRCEVTDTVTDVGSKLGHSYTSKVVKPTYFTKGYTEHTCKNCDNIYRDKATAVLKLKAPSVTKLSALKKGFKLTYKKATGATGYQIQYSTSSKFSGAKTVKTTALSKSVTKLKAKKKYYVRVRTYRTEKGKTVYSPWSSKKAVTTKK